MVRAGAIIPQCIRRTVNVRFSEKLFCRCNILLVRSVSGYGMGTLLCPVPPQSFWSRFLKILES